MTARLLDLYCCAGGAAVGYSRAGFEVYGVDLKAQRNYPFPFRQDDALDVLRRLIAGDAVVFSGPDFDEALTLSDFDAIHASPPCQAYSVTRHSHSVEHPDLLAPTRYLLIEAELAQPGLAWIIENVVGAPMDDPLLLCGSMFGLTAEDVDGKPLRLERHRLFESNVDLTAPEAPHFHDRTITVGGVYGGGRNRRTDQRDGTRRGGYTPLKHVRAALLGIDWPVTMWELSQSIPPAYTEFLGGQIRRSLA